MVQHHGVGYSAEQACEKRREVWTDEETLYSYLNYLDLAAIKVQVVVLAKFPTWEARRSLKCCTFLATNPDIQLWPWLEKRKEVPRLPKAYGGTKSISFIQREKNRFS